MALGANTTGELALDNAGDRAYLTSWSLQPAFVVIDLGRLLITPVNLPTDLGDAQLPRARSPKLSPDGRWLYALADRNLVVLDTATNTLNRRIPLRGSFNAALALSPDGRYAYASDRKGEVKVVDLTADRLVGSGQATGRAERGMASSSDGCKLYLFVAAGLDVFDTSAFG